MQPQMFMQQGMPQGNFRMMPPMGGMPNPMMGGMPQGNMLMRPGIGGPMGGLGGPMGQPQMASPMMMQNPMMMNPALGMQRGPAGMPQARPVMAQPKPQGAHPSGLDANFLASMSPEQQKNVLGERLYTYIVKKHPKQAAKITGMLLEMDNSEILNLLDSPVQLDAKVQEAMDVLERHDGRM